MKKKYLLIIFAVFLVLVAGAVFFIYNQKSKDILKVSDSQITLLLKKNSDARDYMQSHADFKIKSKEILTQQSILAGQNGTNFKEVYQALSLEDNRYILINLMNQAGSNGLISVIDIKEKNTPVAYGILLFKAGQ